jgi:hypothetical protein
MVDGERTLAARRVGTLVGAGVGLASAVVALVTVGGVLTTVQGIAAAGAISFVVGWLGAVALYRRLTADGGDLVWNLIPSRQYGGRHAESGGIARAEQEEALEEVREQTEAMERQLPDE